MTAPGLLKSDGVKLVYRDCSLALLLINKNNRNNIKEKSRDFYAKIEKWLGNGRRRSISEPKRGCCFTMRQTGFVRMKSFIFL
jgi:hypothetical protein